jgi:hypothetical protein
VFVQNLNIWNRTLHVIVNLFFVAVHPVMLSEAGSFVNEAYV